MEARGPEDHQKLVARRKARGKRTTIVVAIIAAVLGFAIMALWFSTRRTTDESATGTANRAASANENRTAPAASPTAEDENAIPLPGFTGAETRATPRPDASPRQQESFFARIFELDEDRPANGREREPLDWLTTFARVTVRLTLAAMLTALLAFRPRRYSSITRRNPFVAQTQILLAVVASALMMIVGDSAARAFGIFAAVSLVRFRTNIKDPKEITVLLVSLAIGLATGVGRWELATILAFFVLLLLWGLEYRETEQVTRAMELTVKTRNVEVTQDMLLRLFRKYEFDAEVRTLDHPDNEGDIGCIVYYVNISPFISTDRLSDEILTADPQNVDSVEWDQQKNTSYFYQ